MSSTAEIMARCQGLFEDLNYSDARAWKAKVPGRKVVGFLPVYVPLEMVHAAGCLPLGIFGGGDQLEVIHGDAYYQSYICRIPRSTIELGVTGRKITDDDLRRSIKLYNENRRLIREVYAFRAREPWRAPTSEVYVIMRAGLMMEVEEHNQILRDYMDAAAREDRPQRDNVRVAIYGSFCEQPPLNLIKSVEMAGCYVVDDDYSLVNRFLTEDVPTDGDPLAALAETYLKHSVETSCKYVPKEEDKGKFHVESVRKSGAEGVIYATPSFCDPALLDRPMIAHRLTEAGIPHINFKYAENSGQMQPIREQAGTFADSLKLWS